MQAVLEAAADPRQGRVVILAAGSGFRSQHERDTRHWIADQVAALKGYAFRPADPVPDGASTYLLPSDALALSEAIVLGLKSEHDFLGGIVPHPFVATKAIVHPLISRDAAQPEGWSHDFPEAVRDVVLKGFTVFSRDDAIEAARRMLESSAIRLKAVEETGGRGQIAVQSEDDLDAALAHFDPGVIARAGLVIEENLLDVITFSVGQVRFGDMVASYHGTQTLTRNHDGNTAYGGSALAVTRGGFDALLANAPTPEVALAVEQAMRFDAAADRCFPQSIISRRNYDVARGSAADGTVRAGVLEQSWRMGGATPAEILAIKTLIAEPTRHTVHAVCVETYRQDVQIPPNAAVTFNGDDPDIGHIKKYVYIDPC
ncbi:DUF3182 family protein [Tianweitania populi]|uniref:DUF3182 family protein n=1 Tax=Tianweitania populi TaxID=1607949 RepID=A0A8J3GKJ3_9HYPH|nr:DUF3182 family protein [Tianweitania populi]GHD14657.1 hypothetical protein GCM10016234_20480 [Tianweitania populi]